MPDDPMMDKLLEEQTALCNRRDELLDELFAIQRRIKEIDRIMQ